MTIRVTKIPALVLLAALTELLCLLTACQAGPDTVLINHVANGQYGQARAHVLTNLTQDRSDRAYLLDRMKLAVVTLDDGYPEMAQTTFESVYNILRTQGINRDNTVASVVLTENVKFWKGEPFEQALAMIYYGCQQAAMGYWDNARAGAQSSLFNLKDFSGHFATGQDKPQLIDTEAILQRSIAYERAKAKGGDPDTATKQPDTSDFLNSGYAVHESDFVLGYMLNAIANRQLARDQEAQDNFAVAVRIKPDLAPLARELRGGNYNTVLVVGWGLGPQKVAYGPDGSLAKFTPRYLSDSAGLIVRVQAGGASGGTSGGTSEGGMQTRGVYPIVTDVNRMAADHMWNNLEDVRKAKSLIGDVMLAGGLIAAGVGVDQRNETAIYAGLGAAAAGLFLKATAHADTRHMEVFPQRFYIVPLQVAGPGDVIMLQVEGKPGSRLLLTGLAPPAPGQPALLRMVRLVSTANAPQWATSGQILYANDVAPASPGSQPSGPDMRPYIAGGRSSQPPTARAMAAYHQAGHYNGMTSNELANIYRAEGLYWDIGDMGGIGGKHLLEGGNIVLSPQAGTTGFARLFGQLHPPYRPRSEELKALIK